MTFWERLVGWRLSSDGFDRRLGQVLCLLGAPALLVIAMIRLMALPASPLQFVMGVLLSLSAAGMMVALGMAMLHSKPAGFNPRQIGCFMSGVLFLGAALWGMGYLGLTPTEVLLGVLLTVTVSLSVITLGMVLPKPPPVPPD
jgi:hypothetical protein